VEGVCSNRQISVISGEGVWPNRHIMLIVAKKLTTYFALFTVYVGEGGWLKTSYGSGRGLLKTSEYCHIGKRGSKIAQKNVI